jgi:hypothetical protein
VADVGRSDLGDVEKARAVIRESIERAKKK